MKWFKKKRKLTPKVIEAKEGTIAVLRKYHHYAIGEVDTSTLPYKAYWALMATLQGGQDEISRMLGSKKTEVFSAKQLLYVDVLLEGGNEDVIKDIIMTY